MDCQSVLMSPTLPIVSLHEKHNNNKIPINVSSNSNEQPASETCIIFFIQCTEKKIFPPPHQPLTPVQLNKYCFLPPN